MPKQGIKNHRIKEARAAAGLPQYLLARRSGVTQPFLSQIEAGLKYPTGLTLQKLALGLGCSVEDLYRSPDGSSPVAASQVVGSQP